MWIVDEVYQQNKVCDYLKSLSSMVILCF
uniref:Uncharacterized protein n=1 Tax=Rhizophora mucronata TaxID=61149 RepID=A0A2P2Q2J6_RHIMU